LFEVLELQIAINQQLSPTTPRTKPASLTMLRTVQELNPEYHIVFSLKTNTYHKDREISEVEFCV